MNTTPTTSFEYEIQEENGEKFVVIAKFIGEETEVVIPDEIDGLPVREIGEFACYNRTGLISVAFPKGLKVISQSAFEGCTGLTAVTLPAGLRIIDYDMFRGCTGLTSITFPDGMESLIPGWLDFVDGFFDGCPNLTIHAPVGSVAEAYAKESGIPFEPMN